MLMQTEFSEILHEKNITVAFASSWERTVAACFCRGTPTGLREPVKEKLFFLESRRILNNQNKLLNPTFVRTEWGVVAYRCAERWSPFCLERDADTGGAASSLLAAPSGEGAALCFLCQDVWVQLEDPSLVIPYSGWDEPYAPPCCP